MKQMLIFSHRPCTPPLCRRGAFVSGAILMFFGFYLSVRANDFREVEELRTSHSRVWMPVVEQADGTFVEDVAGSYTELAGGLHWNGGRSGDRILWLPTKLDWEMDEFGGALIIEAPRTAQLSARLTAMPMLMIQPQDEDAPSLSFAFHGLGYLHRASGNFAWIGQAKPSKLQVSGNCGFYPDALTNLSATWVVEHKPGGIGAGLVLHQQPLGPSHYGFSSGEEVDLVVVNEIIDPDENLSVRHRDHGLRRGLSEVLSEFETTGFGFRPIDFASGDSSISHRIDRGYAYWTSEGLQMGSSLQENKVEQEDFTYDEIGVRTSLVRTGEGRLVLYESIPQKEVDNAVERGLLAPPAVDSTDTAEALISMDALNLPLQPSDIALNRVQIQKSLAQLTQARSARAAQWALSAEPHPYKGLELTSVLGMAGVPEGLYIDYETVSASTTNTLHFLGGQTYYVSGAISVSSNLVVEAGAVIKLGGAGKITVLDGASIATPPESYAPATFVSKNCDDIGAMISGSTGTPARGDYQRSLVLYNDEGGLISNLRLAHCWHPLEIQAGAWDLRHLVFRDNYCALTLMEEATAILRNSLIETGKYWAMRLYVDNDTSGSDAPYSDEYQLRAEHVTVLGTNNYIIRYDWTGTGTGYSTLSAVNSVFGAPNYGFCSRNSTSITWMDEFQNCAFTSATSPSSGMRNECVTLPQTIGSYYSAQSTGNYYLALTVNSADNLLIDSGVTTAALKALLTDRSALAPTAIGSPWSTAASLGDMLYDGEQDDALDLGYHYRCVDGVVGSGGLSVEAGLDLKPGQLVATDNTIEVTSGGQVKIQGEASNPVVIVPCWQISDELVGYRPGQSADQWAGLWVKNDAVGTNVLQNTILNGFWRGAVLDPRRMVRMRDNQFGAFEVGLYPYSADEGQGGYSGTLAIDNCIFQGMGTNASGVYVLNSSAVMNCCTIANIGHTAIASGGSGSISITNSLFADCSASGSVSQGFCGYYGTAIPVWATNSRNCGNYPFSDGPFGTFYLNETTGGGDLLRGDIDTAKGGTGTAAASGVYHRTVDPTSETGEAEDEVSIGYHYPPFPVPDGDHDGIADVDEDYDGDGTADVNETDWELFDTDQDGVGDGGEIFEGTDPLDPESVPVASAPDPNGDNPFLAAIGLRTTPVLGDEPSLWTKDVVYFDDDVEPQWVFVELTVRVPEMTDAGSIDIGLTGNDEESDESFFAQTNWDWLVVGCSENANSCQCPHTDAEIANRPEPKWNDGCQQLCIHFELDDCDYSIKRRQYNILARVLYEDCLAIRYLRVDGGCTIDNNDGLYASITRVWTTLDCADGFNPDRIDFYACDPDFKTKKRIDARPCCDSLGGCSECNLPSGFNATVVGRQMMLNFNAGTSFFRGSPARFVLHSDLDVDGLFKPDRQHCYTVTEDPENCVIRDSNGILEHIYSPNCRVDIGAESNGSYSIRYYDLAGQSSEEWFAKTDVQWISTNETLKVTQTFCSESSGGCSDSSGSTTTKTYTLQYNDTSGDWVWTTEDAGLSDDHERRFSIEDDGTIQVVRESVRYDSDNDPSDDPTVERTYQTFSWGRELVREVIDPDDANLTTTWSYHLSGRGYSNPKKVVHPDGSWVEYGYSTNHNGRLSYVLRPFKDGTLKELVEYDYTSHDTNNDSLGPDDDRPRTVTTKLISTASTNTISKTYYSYTDTTKVQKSCPDPITNTWAHADNLVTQWCYYGSSTGAESEKEQLKSVMQPHGPMTYHEWTEGTYSTSSGFAVPTSGPTPYVRHRITHGVRPSSGDYPRLIPNESTQDVIVLDKANNEIEQRLLIYTGAPGNYDPSTSTFDEADWVVTTYDARGRWLTKSYGNGNSESQSFSSCCSRTHTGPNGEITEYTFDASGQVIQEEKKALTSVSDGDGGTFDAQSAIFTLSEYDASGHKTEQIVMDDLTSPSMTSTNRWTFDGAGRLIQSEDPSGLITTITYDSTYPGRSQTRTLPGGATEITTRYLDGQTESITGSSVVARYFDYGIDSSQRYVEETTGHSGAYSKTKTYTDALGRTQKIKRPEYSATGTVTLTEENYYEGATGLLEKVTRTGSADILYEYDDWGKVKQTGQDLDGTSEIQISSQKDRISEIIHKYEKDPNTNFTSGVWFKLSEQITYPWAGSTDSFSIAKNYQRVSLGGGYGNNEVMSLVEDRWQKQTLTTSAYDSSKKLVTVTVTSPEATANSTTITRNGLLQRQESQTGTEFYFQYDNLGNQTHRIQKISSPGDVTTQTQYDEAGRVEKTIDAQGNETEYVYSSTTGQLTEVKVPAPDDGTGTLSTYYAYTLRNEKWRTWGDVDYPVEYTYDDWGRMTQMSTYRGGSSWDGTSWPSSPGTADTTTWAYDEASGLLTGKTDANSESVTYSYWPNGRLKQRTWAEGGTTDYIYVGTYYDAQVTEGNSGELKIVEYSDAGMTTVTNSYTRSGQPHQIMDGAGTRTFAYDTNLVAATETIASGGLFSQNIVIDLSHDEYGRRSGQDVTKGGSSIVSVDYGYEPATGRMNSAEIDDTHAFHYNYLGGTELVGSIEYPSPTAPTLTVSRTYNDLDQDVDESRLLLTQVSNSSDTDTISRYAYEYDELGRRASVVNEGIAFAVQPRHNSFCYNNRGEVTGSHRYEGGDPSSSVTNVTAEARVYSFDNIGNRLTLRRGRAVPGNFLHNEQSQPVHGHGQSDRSFHLR